MRKLLFLRFTELVLNGVEVRISPGYNNVATWPPIIALLRKHHAQYTLFMTSSSILTQRYLASLLAYWIQNWCEILVRFLVGIHFLIYVKSQVKMGYFRNLGWVVLNSQRVFSRDYGFRIMTATLDIRLLVFLWLTSFDCCTCLLQLKERLKSEERAVPSHFFPICLFRAVSEATGSLPTTVHLYYQRFVVAATSVVEKCLVASKKLQPE